MDRWVAFERDAMQSLRYLNSVLTILAVLLSLNLYVAWSAAPVSIASEAQAQGLSNAGAQREEMIGLLKQLNTHMVDVKKTIKDGPMLVRVAPADSN